MESVACTTSPIGTIELPRSIRYIAGFEFSASEQTFADDIDHTDYVR
jgi:hypothetical protein